MTNSANAVSENEMRVRKSKAAFMQDDTSGHQVLSTMTTPVIRDIQHGHNSGGLSARGGSNGLAWFSS
jgi:hypothetical protein